MPILNYTTIVPVAKTVSDIQTLLAKAGANRVAVEYDSDKEPSAILFEIHTLPYKLPCRAEAIFKLIENEPKLKAYKRTHEQAQRVAWRIVKDWVQAQLAIIETQMVELDEVFLPYQVVNSSGKTVYQVYREERPERLLENLRHE